MEVQIESAMDGNVNEIEDLETFYAVGAAFGLKVVAAQTLMKQHGCSQDSIVLGEPFREEGVWKIRAIGSKEDSDDR